MLLQHLRQASAELTVRLQPIFAAMDQATAGGRILGFEVDEIVELSNAVEELVKGKASCDQNHLSARMATRSATASRTSSLRPRRAWWRTPSNLFSMLYTTAWDRWSQQATLSKRTEHTSCSCPNTSMRRCGSSELRLSLRTPISAWPKTARRSREGFVGDTAPNR